MGIEPAACLELIFQLGQYLALAGWVLLALAPNWRGTVKIATGIPLALASLYTLLLVFAVPNARGNMGTLAGVAELFSQPPVLLAGWLHYLCFDLFIGAWQVRDSRRMHISHLYVLPCLLLTLFAGPLGLLAYFSVRTVLRRNYYLA